VINPSEVRSLEPKDSELSIDPWLDERSSREDGNWLLEVTIEEGEGRMSVNEGKNLAHCCLSCFPRLLVLVAIVVAESESLSQTLKITWKKAVAGKAGEAHAPSRVREMSA